MKPKQTYKFYGTTFHLEVMALMQSGYCNYIVVSGGINCNDLYKQMDRHFAQMAPGWM